MKEEKPEKDKRTKQNAKMSLIPVRDRSIVPVGRRQRRCQCRQIWEDEVSHHMAEAIKVMLGIPGMLATMGETRVNKSPKRLHNVVATWQCEEAWAGGWALRVCRDLLGIGTSQTCTKNQCTPIKERMDKHLVNCQAVSKSRKEQQSTQMKERLDRHLTNCQAVSKTCKENQCTQMKERLNKHLTNCQAVSKPPIIKPRQEKTTMKMDQAISTTNTSVSIFTSRPKSPLNTNTEIQTSISNFTPVRDKQINKIDKEQNCVQDGHKTVKVLPKTNWYSERLRNAIQEFFRDIPVYPNMSELVKKNRLLIINDFVDKIANLFIYVNNEDYNDKVKDKIEQCLRNLPMWEPESDQDKNIFKNGVSDSLFKFIKTFNEQWFNIINSFRKNTLSTSSFPNDLVVYNNHTNHNLENVITDWVQYNLKSDSKTEIVINTLLSKLQLILESGTKCVTKPEILHIFEELSPYLHLPRNESLQLNKFASDLANVLSTMEGKDNVCDDYPYKKIIGFEDDKYSMGILKDSKLINDFEDDTVNQITDILFGNLDLVLHENNSNVVIDVCTVLKSAGEFSDSEAGHLAKTLVANVKDCFNDDFFAKMGNPNHSIPFLILTSEQELSLSTNEQKKGSIKRSNYKPNTLDILMLEENISVWMNEQPSDIFEVSDKATRNQFMQELAINIQETLAGNNPEQELNNEIAKWLNKIVKPQMRRNVDGLAENLKDKIINVRKDDTLSRTPKHSYLNAEVDVKVNEFVENFIQRNYDIDDDVVKGVLSLMLKQELHKISPPIREDLYKKFSNDSFNTDKFQLELEIVIEVYDWLKKISFYYPLLKSRSETIDFIHGLARNITDIERERVTYPNKMDYNSWLHTEIAVYLLQKETEISDKDLPKIDYHANELCLRILNRGKNSSEGDLNKIIAKYMKKHDTLLAKDYLKKVLWHRRLGENVMKMLLENPAASQPDVEKSLASVPIPRDESVFNFKMEIKYNITIQDWFHALPLIPPVDNVEALTRKNMIQELLQAIIKNEERKGNNSDDNKADEDLDQYIADWISRLNFDPTMDVDKRVLRSDLRSRIEFIKWTEKQSLQTPNLNLQGEINRTRHSKTHDTKPKDPGEEIVEAIDTWCNNLPIQTYTDDGTKVIKEQVATNMFQIIGSLNGDPIISNDKQKFRDTLANEIEAQLQNLSEHDAVRENKEILKAELLDQIIEIKDKIKNVNAGDDYVQALENSMDMSLSKPPSGASITTNPGYELFKKRMVMLWLLENYDYSVDYHSLKYKKMLSDEIDLFSEKAQKEDIFPADKEETMNDLMSVFYKAQPPNENAVMYEVQSIKLRCEVELWAKELPLRANYDYNKLLERDQILTILSKLLFDIESYGETNADEQMHAEIMKWSKKLPLLPEEKNNLTRYADLLVCLLKASVNSRKCQREPEPKNLTIVQETLKNLKSSDELNRMKDTSSVPKINRENTSQVAGPSAPRSYTHEYGVTKEKLIFLITKAIENWVNQLPLQFNSPSEQNLAQRTKEQIIHRLMHLVSELHHRPNTLNEEGLYEYYLNNELENIQIQLTKERLYWEAQIERNERKYQLINALKAIRPLVKDEKEKEGYRDRLKHTISSFHESMVPYSAVQLSKETEMSILDDFLHYKTHTGDFENQELDKLKIKEALNSEFNDREMNIDPLLAANRLISEMSKVKFPTQSQTQRRFSQPNPLANSSRFQPIIPSRRLSLPYPIPETSGPRLVSTQRFPHQQPVIPFPDPMPRSIYQTPPDFQQRPRPVPARRNSQTASDIQARPFSPPQPSPRRPMQQSSMPLPAPMNPRSRLDLQQEPAMPSPLPRRLLAQENLEVRPFPMRLSTYDYTDTNHLSPRSQPQIPNAQPRFVENLDAVQSYRELRGPQNVEQQYRYLNVRPQPETRTTATIQNDPRSLGECPEEQRRTNRHERWCDRESRCSHLDYCETCERDRECDFFVPRPCPMPLDYMPCWRRPKKQCNKVNYNKKYI